VAQSIRAPASISTGHPLETERVLYSACPGLLAETNLIRSGGIVRPLKATNVYVVRSQCRDARRVLGALMEVEVQRPDEPGLSNLLFQWAQICDCLKENEIPPLAA
jgi:hypothetical protein